MTLAGPRRRAVKFIENKKLQNPAESIALDNGASQQPPLFWCTNAAVSLSGDLIHSAFKSALESARLAAPRFFQACCFGRVAARHRRDSSWFLDGSVMLLKHALFAQA